MARALDRVSRSRVALTILGLAVLGLFGRSLLPMAASGAGFRLVPEEASPSDAGGQRVIKVVAEGGETFVDVLQQLQEGGDACDELSNAIASAPFSAVFWELPGLSLEKAATAPFEFVMVDAPALAEQLPDPETFSGYFNEGEKVASFANLRGDSILVAPTPWPGIDHSAYVSMAPMMRSDGGEELAEQRRHLWAAVASSLLAALSEDTGRRIVWLSTSGLGVAWLHVRLDSRPKYYTYRPYTARPQVPAW